MNDLKLYKRLPVIVMTILYVVFTLIFIYTFLSIEWAKELGHFIGDVQKGINESQYANQRTQN